MEYLKTFVAIDVMVFIVILFLYLGEWTKDTPSLDALSAPMKVILIWIVSLFFSAAIYSLYLSVKYLIS